MIATFLLMEMLGCRQLPSNAPNLDPQIPAINVLKTEVVKFDPGTYRLDLTIQNCTGHKIHYKKTRYGSIITMSFQQLVNGKWKTNLIEEGNLEIVRLGDRDSVTESFYYHDLQYLPSYTTDSLSFYFQNSKNGDFSDIIHRPMNICVKHIDREEH